MANGLTGDFDVALQVSESTLNRLVATLHQNGSVDSALPSIAHVARFRIGDANPAGFERGSVAAQVGAPRVVLIDGATDRFRLEVGFRARYRPDPGSAPLADVIHGTIRAVYRIAPIDSTCPGWADIAENYLWFRVLRTSVSFDGPLYRTGTSLLADMFDEDEVRAHFTKHLARLLADQFEPKPFAIGPRFRRLLARSRAGGAGIAVPLSIDGSVPSGGDLTSIGQVFLHGHDFAIAISSDCVVRAVQEQLNGFVGRMTKIHHTRDAGIGGGLVLDYSVRVDGVTAEWLGAAVFGSAGVVRITVTVIGWCDRLYRSGVYNLGSIEASDLRMRAAVEQCLLVGFDAGGARLTVSALGDPTVTFVGEVNGMVKAAAAANLVNEVKTSVGAALGPAQARLDAQAFGDELASFVEQLRSVDPAADAHFTGAAFERDGVVLHGAVQSSERAAPHLEFVPGPGPDFFDAIETWIPGGRVDSFEWTWRWLGSPIEAAPGPAGARTEQDSFRLGRPARTWGRFGPVVGGENPLPGLDGSGEVCLRITGVQVDSVTGALVPVRYGPYCRTWGHRFKMPVALNGPYVRVCDPLRARGGNRAPEVGRLLATADPGEATPNVLLMYGGSRWHSAAGATVRQATARCRRTDAGLIVVALFREGAFDGLDLDAIHELRSLRSELEAPLLITDDVDGTWRRWLALEPTDEAQWRLIDPEGITSWVGRGAVEAGELTDVLDARLVTSVPAYVGAPNRNIDGLGRNFPVEFGDAAKCPPIPLRRPGTIGSRVLFADGGAASSAMIDHVTRAVGDPDHPPCVAVVFTGAAAAEVRIRRGEHDQGALPAEFIADPHGELARAVGVAFTPSLYTLDAVGRVVDVTTSAPTATSESRDRS